METINGKFDDYLSDITSPGHQVRLLFQCRNLLYIYSLLDVSPQILEWCRWKLCRVVNIHSRHRLLSGGYDRLDNIFNKYSFLIIIIIINNSTFVGQYANHSSSIH